MKSQMLKYDHIEIEDVAIYLYNYIIIFYAMIKYPVFIINKSQVKISCCLKDGHNAHF